ncbi:glycosyltransferase, partial [bacterium]|nr:glycosyltransferase [bacterium]
MVESMACQTAVIATNLPGVRSVVIDGENGKLADPGDVESLRTKLDYLLEHPEEVTSLVPRVESSKGFNPERVTYSVIAKFLGWKEHRIRESLEAIKDIDEGTIDKDTYEGFKTQYQADAFRKTAKKVNLKPEEQK